MALICTNITTFVLQEVTNPVSTWVEEQQQKCNSYPWPLNWLCWFVTVLVEVIIWVVDHILVPVIKVICMFITFVIGGVLLPFGAAIDALCQKCHAYDWIKDWFIGCAKIEGLTEKPSATNPDEYDFTFRCNCTCFSNKTISISAKTEEEAFELAKIECEKACI